MKYGKSLGIKKSLVLILMLYLSVDMQLKVISEKL